MNAAEHDALLKQAERSFETGQLDAYVQALNELQDLPNWADWMAAGAYMAWTQQRPDAADLLAAAVRAGYTQPEFLPVDLTHRPDWPELRAQLLANRPEPWVTVTDWSEGHVDTPLWLESLPEARLEEFRTHLPPPEATAWSTALSLLVWARERWEHDGDNDGQTADALELIQRSERGERFRCVEYGRVLSAALNARSIPARRAALKTRHHHTGSGQGHVATEAWIDDFNAWVLLDPQNGGYWGEENAPLGVRALCEWYWSGAEPPAFQALGAPLSAYEARVWWQYFARVQSGDALWVPAGQTVSPQFQDRYSLNAPRLSRNSEAIWPDLSAVEVGFESRSTHGALRLGCAHPDVTHFEVGGSITQGNPAVVPFDSLVGQSEVTVRGCTPYGALAARTIFLQWLDQPQAGW